MSDSGGISEDGTIANSVGDVGKPAGNNIESNLAGINPSTEEVSPKGLGANVESQ